MNVFSIFSLRNKTEELRFSWPDYPPKHIPTLGGKVVVCVDNPLPLAITADEVLLAAYATQNKLNKSIAGRGRSIADMEKALEKDIPQEQSRIIQLRKDLAHLKEYEIAVEMEFNTICKLIDWLKAAPLEIIQSSIQPMAVPCAPPLQDTVAHYTDLPPPSYDEVMSTALN